jgi:hypothetical protein
VGPGDRSHANGITLVDFALLKPITQYATHPLSKAWSYAPLSSAQVQAEANRLLEQSTFGANDVLLTHVQSIGTQAFLNEQFAAAAGQYPAIKYVPAGQQATFCPTDPDPSARARLLLAIPASERFLSERASRK